MSILPMFKTCPVCHKKYSYNPSTGNLGIMCPYCIGKPADKSGVFGGKKKTKEKKTDDGI